MQLLPAILLIAFMPDAAAAPLWGVATNMLDKSDAGMTTLCNAGMEFWWNWAPAPRMLYSSACAKSFVSMIWGLGDPALGTQAGAYKAMMGFNEPDHWSPGKPGGDVNSAGTFTVNFHCSSDSLAEMWQKMVTNYLAANPNGIVVSPAMSDAAGIGGAGDYSRCDFATQMATFRDMTDCPGWLKCFKAKVSQLDCGKTNCWDVISVIQFHTYQYTSQALQSVIQLWEQKWAEDIAGSNGHTKKTFWLTEWAHAGTTDASDPDGKARQFMTESINFMKARPSISGFSWFSQPNFPSFDIMGQKPVTPTWTSELINPTTGQLTVIGQTYVSLCKTMASNMTAVRDLVV